MGDCVLTNEIQDRVPARAMNEKSARALFISVLRKEYLASVFEKGKITGEQYVHSVNELRAEAGFPPLSEVPMEMPLRMPAGARHARGPVHKSKHPLRFRP